MANPKSNAAAAATTAPAANPVPNGTATLRVALPNGYKLPKQGTARAAWLAVLQAHNGKTVAQFYATVQAKPPSTPTRGKLAGQLEPIPGWFRHFTKAGVLTLVQPK